MTELTVGQKAPGFELDGDGGKTLRLSDYSGHPVVVYFYPKDDTPGCTKEALSFSCLSAEFTAKNITVIGISPDTAAKHDKFKAKHELTVRLASDPETATCQDYGVWVEKSMYGKTYMGVERSTFLIDSKGGIAHVWRKVKVAGHAEEVLEAAAKL